MERTIYVKFLYENLYPRYQIFQDMKEETYYGRDHFLLWHTVHVDNEQKILEMVVPKEVCFIICDNENRKILESSNKKNKMNFPLLRYRCLAEWDEVREEYCVINENGFAMMLRGIHKSNLGKWLLTYRKEFASESKRQKCSEDEWITNFQDILAEPEILHTFDYCGRLVQIYRMHKQHMICKKEWYEYYSGNEYVGIEMLSKT